MEYDADLLPTGQLIADNRFLSGCLLSGIHLDNGYVWSEDEGQEYKCVVKNKDIELTILPDRSFPVLQVFTPDDRKSIAIENLSSAPDAFNNKIGLIELGPEDSQAFQTRYRIAKIKKEDGKKEAPASWWRSLFSGKPKS